MANEALVAMYRETGCSPEIAAELGRLRVAAGLSNRRFTPHLIWWFDQS
jgi:hypothetical protein